MDVLKGEEGKRVASGGRHVFGRRAASGFARGRKMRIGRGRSVLESVVFQSRNKRQ